MNEIASMLGQPTTSIRCFENQFSRLSLEEPKNYEGYCNWSRLQEKNKLTFNKIIRGLSMGNITKRRNEFSEWLKFAYSNKLGYPILVYGEKLNYCRNGPTFRSLLE